MFTRVIVGVDEHEGGHDAIALANRLASADAQVTLTRVDATDPFLYRGVSALYESRERERALGQLRAVAVESKPQTSLEAISSTSVGRGLHELAEVQKADLLLVGSSRRGLAGRVLLGDDTHAALNGAPCAVAVAPAGYAANPSIISEIGIGYDASPESEQALAIGRVLAAELGARLSALHVISVPAYVLGAGPAPIEASIDDAVAEARERIAALGDIEPHAAYGSPAEELTLFSASVGLLIIGSRGYGPLGRIVHGSVSLRLARSARSPLLVLPRRARSDAQADRG
jgi:nucleotide-binding universal stress UspA family protein